jgi:hypothetical protein
LIHASRTDRQGSEALDSVEGKKLPEAREGVELLVRVSGGRVRNTWVICLKEGNNCSKEQLIPRTLLIERSGGKAFGSL